MKCNTYNNHSSGNRPHIRYSIERPKCPFCGIYIERPKELEVRRPSEMPVGVCTCGAVYAYDASGRNLGTAFNEALVFGCDMNWDLAFNLLPEEDYIQQIVENYDFETHQIVPGGFYEGRKIAGALFFVRLQSDIQEYTSDGVKKKFERAIPHYREHDKDTPARKKINKKELENAINNYQVEFLMGLAAEDKRLLREMQRYLYSADELFRLRTADLIGKVSSVIAKKDPAVVSGLLQKLITSVRDTAASSWGAIDTAGEIISHSPGIFAGYVPELQMLLSRDESLQPLVLRALAKIAKVRPDFILKTISYLTPFLEKPSPETRGYAALLFTYLNVPDARDYLEAIKEETHKISIYENGEFFYKTIGELATEALKNLE